MPKLSTPGVYIEEIPSGSKKIMPAETAIAVFIGYSTKGPAKQTRKVTSWQEFEKIYGQLTDHFLLGQAVYYFFKNGGQQAHIIRLEINVTPTTDQVALPNSYEFLDALFPNQKNSGAYLLNKIDSFNLLNVPGLSAVAQICSLQQICKDKNAFLIVDSTHEATFQTYENGLKKEIQNNNSQNSAFYFPWINVKSISGNSSTTIPPGGFVAGVYAHTDAIRGVWKAPAGIAAELSGAIGPTCSLNDNENMILNPLGINCIRQFPTFGTIVWGARTLSLDTEWSYVPVRRLFLFIEESIRQSIQWAVFEPNDEPLWSSIRAHINEFLLNLFRQGAFAGNQTKDSFFVKCGRDTTTDADIEAGQFIIQVGFAPLKPAEFVILQIIQKASS